MLRCGHTTHPYQETLFTVLQYVIGVPMYHTTLLTVSPTLWSNYIHCVSPSVQTHNCSFADELHSTNLSGWFDEGDAEAARRARRGSSAMTFTTDVRIMACAKQSSLDRRRSIELSKFNETETEKYRQKLYTTQFQ